MVCARICAPKFLFCTAFFLSFLKKQRPTCAFSPPNWSHFACALLTHILLSNITLQVFYSDRAPRPMVPLTLPDGTTVASCLDRVLRLPSVASKRWLVHKVRVRVYCW